MFSHFHKIFDSLNALERRFFFGAIALTIIAGSLWGIHAFYTSTTLEPVEGGSFVEGVVGQPIAINPLVASGNDVDRDLSTILFSDLLTLAETYRVEENQRTWTVSLKPDLFWSDGMRLTTNDIIFTVETIQNPDTRSPLAPSFQGVNVERVSEREVRLTLKIPYAFFLETLRDLRIVPKHIFGNIPPANLRLSDYNLEPVGSGPYVFKEYQKQKDGYITEFNLVTNPHYAGEPPHIPTFTFKFFKDYDELINAFNRRQVDGMGGLDHEKIDRLSIGNQILEMHMPRYYAVFLNPNAHPALKQPKVREALARATDRAVIIERVFQNRALPILGPVHPDVEGFAASTTPGEIFSAEEARAILETDKWKQNDEGIWEKTIGKSKVTLEFEIVVPKIQFLIDTVDLIHAQWEAVGIRLTPILLSPAEVGQSTIKTRNYQLIIFGNILKRSPDVFSFWHSSERFFPGLNLSLYESKPIDELLETVRTNASSTVRNTGLEKIQEIITRDRPAIFLYSPHYLYATPKDLGGVTDELLGSPSDRFREVSEWYRKTARVFK